MAPRNSTPHTKRVKGGSHGYNPYARPTCSNGRPKPPPLDLIPIVGMVLPDKPLTKKKVRFHQRGPRIEPDDAGIVFPAPAKEPTTPPARFVAREDAPTPVIGGFGMERFPSSNFSPGDLGHYSYEQLVDRVKGLESMLRDSDETIAVLKEQLRSAEKDNKSLKRQLEKSRRSGPRDDEFSRLLTGGSQKASRRVTIGAAPDVIDEDMMMFDSFSTPSSFGRDGPSMERAGSSSSVLVFPSSSPSSDISDVVTPNDSPYGVNRVIDENYDEGLEEYISASERNQHQHIVQNVLNIQTSMNPDQMLDRIAESMPRVWNIKDKDEEERKRRISLTLRGPPMPTRRPNRIE